MSKGDLRGGPDWRDPTTYKPLLALDRAGWAWIWLKRNADYAARATQSAAPAPPDQTGRNLRIITATEAEEAPEWGLHFRGSPGPPPRRGEDFLAGRLACIGTDRRSHPGLIY